MVDETPGSMGRLTKLCQRTPACMSWHSWHSWHSYHARPSSRVATSKWARNVARRIPLQVAGSLACQFPNTCCRFIVTAAQDVLVTGRPGL